jgi:hypothetical protein
MNRIKAYIATSSRMIFILGVTSLVYFFLFNQSASAASKTYYISPGGDDSNSGSDSSSPFATFDKAITVLQPGDTLSVMAGEYKIMDNFDFNPMGTESRPIAIQAYDSNQKPTINFGYTVTNPKISGRNLIIKNIQFTQGHFCISITGVNITFSGVVAHDCSSGGININGQGIIIEDSEVYSSNLDNSTREEDASWNSGLKVGLGGKDIILRRNKIYNNYGEGIAVTRGANVEVINNVIFDNYAIQLYIDNSYNILVDSNLIYCTENTKFDSLTGIEATGIGLGEEYYSKWGAQLKRIKIVNNIVSACGRGFANFFQIAGGGMDDVIIAHNTFWEIDDRVFSISNGIDKSQNTYIMNNIFDSLSSAAFGYMDDSTGIEFSNNLWVDGEPQYKGDVTGPGDIYGSDPMFITPPVINDPTTFRLSPQSPAAKTAAEIPNFTLSHDFFGATRVQPSELGAVSLPAPAPTATPLARPSDG